MALVVIYANLQRLMVFRSSVARIEGRELDPDQRLELTSRMDLLNGVIGRSGQSRSVADEGSGVRIAVVRRSDDQFIGWLTFNSWDPTFRSASLGFCFVETAWGCGYATASADALLTWAYATLDVNRVQAETDTRNPGSARVLEKLGFVREGMLRQDCIVNGVISDSWVYGLLRSDWENTTTASVGGVLGTEAAATPRVSS